MATFVVARSGVFVPALFLFTWLASLCCVWGQAPEAENGKSAGPADAPATELPPDLAQRHTGDDWPGFLGPGRDSIARESKIHTDWSNDPPRLVWQTRVGESYGICSIYRGRCFQFDRVGNKARLDCRHSETGEQLWTYEYPMEYEDLYGYNNGPRCSPVLDGDKAYLYGVDGQLHCVRIRDGQRVWSVDTVKQYGVIQNFFGVGSTPVIEGDLLLCVVGGSPEKDRQVAPGQLDEISSNGTAIVAFDKQTGVERYRFGDDLASYAGIQTASWQGRRWGFAFLRGGLMAFEPSTGKVDFHYPWRAKILESVNASNPVVVGNQVFISETYGPGSCLLEFSPGKHQVVWADSERVRHRAMQTHWNTAIHLGGYLYGSSGRHTQNAELRCIELATGKVQWSEPDLSRCSLLAIDGPEGDDFLVCLGEYGRLMMLRANPQKFELLGELELMDPATDTPLIQYPAWAAPILAHGYLYVRGRDRLVCLDVLKP